MVKTLLHAACRIALILGCGSSVVACAPKMVGWHEDVRLSDGRKIVVDRKAKCRSSGYIGPANCVTAENWLTFDLPEFSPKPIVWHQTRLFAVLLNVDAGKLYAVGYPLTDGDYALLGRPKSPFIAFVWRTDQWQQIPIRDVPSAIYDRNIFIGDALPGGGDYLPLARKEGAEDGMLDDPRAAPFLKRVDPEFTLNDH